MTWGGLPLFVPVGYISYFVLPAVTGAALGRWVATRFNWRRPQTLLVVGLVVGFCWALFFNGFLGAKLGVFYYGRVIPGLAIREGTLHQYPLYDSLAMGIQMMLFTYLLGRTDDQGRNVIEMWAQNRAKNRVTSSILSVVAVIVIGNVLYGAVFAPHLATKLGGWVTTEPPAGSCSQASPTNRVSDERGVVARNRAHFTQQLHVRRGKLRQKITTTPGAARPRPPA